MSEAVGQTEKDTATRAQTAGIAFGFAAAVIWSSYLGLARTGALMGITSVDFVMLRFAPAALLAIPFAARNGMFSQGVTPWRALALTFFGGPPFMLLSSAGFQFTPLAHGAVLMPGTMTTVSLIISVVVFGDALTVARLLGVAIIISGLALVSGLGLGVNGAGTAIGDAMFMMAGSSWAIFTLLLRRWKVDALRATVAVSVIAGLCSLPMALAAGSFPRLATMPASIIIAQILGQGVFAGFLAVVCYARSVTILGSARATLFPACVPALAVIIGIPVTGEWPSFAQWGGAGLVSFGLLLGVGALGAGPVLRRARGA